MRAEAPKIIQIVSVRSNGFAILHALDNNGATYYMDYEKKCWVEYVGPLSIESARPADGGQPILPVRLGEHPTRYYNWKSHFTGWTQREEEVAHAAYIAGWYHRCNQDPDAIG